MLEISIAAEYLFADILGQGFKKLDQPIHNNLSFLTAVFVNEVG
jgi:hypothetical protein